MNYQGYENYMRSVLGNPYTNEYTNVSTYSNNTSEQNVKESEEILKIQKMYPDIYCLLMPMVNKIVEENIYKEITNNLIDSMTMEIYNNIEDDMIGTKEPLQQNSKIFSNKNTLTTNTLKINNLQNTNSKVQSTQIGNLQRQVTQSNNTSTKTTMQNTKTIGNPTLRDLIKILIINKLLECKRKTLPIDNNFNVPVNQNWGMNNSYVPVMNLNPIMNQMPLIPRVNMQNSQIPSLPMQNIDRQVSVNMNRINYPFTNYFSVPYPEDE